MWAYGGIDPGMSGGMALVDENGRAVRAVKMPDTEQEIIEELGLWNSHCSFIHVSLEKVHAMPKQGVSSTFKFGMGYGGLRMALVASAIPFDEVVPRRWQASLSCLTGGDKNISKRKAQDLFPQMKVTHALADALLLAEYCRRTKTGTR